jgi:hypothetical protein
MSVLLTSPVPFFAFKLAQLKQVSFYKRIELFGQRQAVILKLGTQTKPGRQAQTLVVLFTTPEELPTLLQVIHPRSLSMYELVSGH